MPENAPRILIVDDRPENRYVLSKVLRRAGYDCVEIGSGAEALSLASTLPDLMVLDVRLPDMSGYEVCQKIKSDPHTAQISILQISASFVSSEDRAKALEAGADGYLTHPIDGMVLVATVRALLRLRAAEATATRSSRQWQATFDALSEGVALVNAEGGLLRWNGKFSEIVGAFAELVHGLDMASLFDKLLGDGAFLKDHRAERYKSEFAIGQRTVQVSVNQIDVKNAEAGKVLVLSDITDRKLAEYALRTAEKIAATGKLAHAIAHEINNPLEALTNLVYLARTTNTAPAIHQLLVHAESEVDRIARITRQTLSFQRDTQHPVTVDVGELVSNVVAVYQKSASARRVRVVCHRRPALAISGFPGQLGQVFSNLIRNAAEAAPSGSEVIVRVRTVRRKELEGTRVTIHDRGTGIPAEIRKQLFDPFFTTKELKGSGLGLWVSKNLIMKHAGTIRYRSSTREGASGTSFEVFLPVGGIPVQTSYSDTD